MDIAASLAPTLVDQLVELALQAGSEILRLYDTDFAVRFKDDCSPVTAADEAAEAIIVFGLARIAPDVPVVAEEAAAAGRMPEIGERFFLVDPLDGSREFINRNGEFTVNIALVEAGAPLLGVVYAPAQGRIWWGHGGHGAWQGRVVADVLTSVVPISVRTCSRAGLDVVGSRSHASSVDNTWLERYPVARFMPAGSSLKFCLLASGDADLYPRLGRTMEWDTAAGDAVLRAAGGRVETLSGERLRYGKRNQTNDIDFANPHFVAFGDPDLTESIWDMSQYTSHASRRRLT